MSFNLFSSNSHEPLASRLRPQKITDFIGQEHLLGPGCALSQMLQAGRIHSMVLWGPPGVGKTTLAHLLGEAVSANVKTLSAVNSGVKEIREITLELENLKKDLFNTQQQKQNILLIDEIHRFSKSQQDALLPLVESGLITLIGATTENPSFELNKALLSRTRVHVLKALDTPDLLKILNRALKDQDQGYGNFLIKFSEEDKLKLIKLARQDARVLLNLLELVIELSGFSPLCPSASPSGLSLPQGERREQAEISIEIDPLLKHLGENILSFDKQGDIFYDAISALHKSIRGSDPDASLYWLAKLLVGGVDGLYIARRLIRIASEDVGNADPRALQICINTWDVLERLGAGEGELALGQAVLFLACAPKSNAGYLAFNQAMALVKQSGSAEIEIPMHLRNSPTQLMTDLGYGKNYRYPHDEPHAYAAGEHYFPAGVSYEFYTPSDRGLEKQIQERLKFLKNLKK